MIFHVELPLSNVETDVIHVNRVENTILAKLLVEKIQKMDFFPPEN
jgi:hypothetical protein